MTRMPPLAGILLIAPALLAQGPLRADRLTFSDPVTLATVETNRLQGEPSRLAWSTDGSQLYLQTLQGGFGRPDATQRHYVFSASTGARRDVDAEPPWAAQYWASKSGQASPDEPTLKIALNTSQRLERTTSVPRGGDLARGGTTVDSGTSVSDGVAAAYNSQSVTVHAMQLKGETIGEFVNSVIVPGLTFGWGPPGSRGIAFSAQRGGRLVVMDEQGAKQEVAGTKDTLLPAWAPDGTRLAWLQRDGRQKYLLRVAGVSGT